ncbi:PREDICTED: very long-chain-fatty-acid--CoA ligase bubblegum isoform X1 [Dufourea novaeangliae]|uniref:very long-chain-fatty-acid--CoA ligase bubblegum isoform X1 n=1 Tax=Dufourea novaeangliae TaxID=178035 RepID=UPI0007670AB0|nr:PREDICTED: very long-chain-fatty-acid--CoA ligase bubblegum isoform X1 [Dufourea novaeangliae]
MVILLFKDNMTTVQPVQSNGVIKGFAANDKEKDFYYAKCNETGLDGPDQVLPAHSAVTTQPNGRVQIKINKEGIGSTPPISVPGLLTKTANTYPDQIAFVTRPDADGERKTYTFKEYETQVRIVAKAFLKLGLERHHSVCILGFNSPEWLISDLAAIYAGGLAAGIYTTNTPEACQYCAESSRANIIVVEDKKQLEKILQIRKNLSHLKAIIMYDGESEEKDVLSWKDVLKIGEKEPDDKLNAVLRTIGVNECCTLVYTSGTVGHPKAVMLSHDNLVHDAKNIVHSYELVATEEVLVSYLPLSHVAAQIVDIYCCMTVAATVYFADKNALKGSLIETLLVARPTVFIGVPRVWEKIFEKMQTIARNNGPIKNWISSWAKAQGLYYYMNKINGNDYKHWGYVFAKWLIFNKVKTALGLDRCKVCITAAAPLSEEIKQYFLSLDILILEAYGMSESSGAHTLGTNTHYRLGSVGRGLPSFSTKVDNPDASNEGEMCMGGRHIFMGYLNDPEKTAEAIDPDGWLRTGDAGKVDSDGYLFITGRLKELIITAGGENVPPVHIEQLVLAELPVLSNALLIGDKRKYLTILVTLKTEMNNKTGAPEDTFTPEASQWLQSIGSKATTVSEVIRTHDPLVYDEIDKAIKRANAKVVSNAQKVQKFKLLPHDFSVPTGELGPTLKVKRNVVHKMYEDLIEDMYK